MSDDLFVVVVPAAESGNVGSVLGPLPEADARTINESLWECGIENGFYRCRPVDMDERLFLGSMVVYDPPQVGALNDGQANG